MYSTSMNIYIYTCVSHIYIHIHIYIYMYTYAYTYTCVHTIHIMLARPSFYCIDDHPHSFGVKCHAWLPPTCYVFFRDLSTFSHVLTIASCTLGNSHPVTPKAVNTMSFPRRTWKTSEFEGSSSKCSDEFWQSYLAGWWFGTWILYNFMTFHHIWDVILPIDELGSSPPAVFLSVDHLLSDCMTWGYQFP